MHLAELEIRARDLERAQAHADEALAIEDQGPESQTLGFALYVRAHVAAPEGDVELATDLATRGLSVGRAVGRHLPDTQPLGAWPARTRTR